PAEERVERLNAVSAKRVIDPDESLTGRLGDGQILADELLSIADLDIAATLTAEQKAKLSREEIASITNEGIRFEAVLEAGFALQVVHADDLTDPRITYLLHEMGEETRHQRVFVRLLQQLQPTSKHPLDRPLVRFIQTRAIARIINKPALFYTLVLGGEEIPDLLQKIAGEHPETDPFLAEVNRYHRQEEARHLAFARLRLPEVWETTSRTDRLAVRFVAPLIIGGMFDMLVHPGVYETIGLPGWATWKAAKASPRRVALRHEATRPIVRALLDANVLKPGQVPTPWRRLCGVDAAGQPVTAAA
ncbi:MAG: diiron oxygenase, partial [Actinomycetota bacterium]